MKTAAEWRELLSRKAVEKTSQFETWKAWYQPQKDIMGQYCHRDRPDTWLRDCKAEALHGLLKTPVAVQLKED